MIATHTPLHDTDCYFAMQAFGRRPYIPYTIAET
jgi:hypothetical protein